MSSYYHLPILLTPNSFCRLYSNTRHLIENAIQEIRHARFVKPGSKRTCNITRFAAMIVAGHIHSACEPYIRPCFSSILSSRYRYLFFRHPCDIQRPHHSGSKIVPSNDSRSFDDLSVVLQKAAEARENGLWNQDRAGHMVRVVKRSGVNWRNSCANRARRGKGKGVLCANNTDGARG